MRYRGTADSLSVAARRHFLLLPAQGVGFFSFCSAADRLPCASKRINEAKLRSDLGIVPHDAARRRQKSPRLMFTGQNPLHISLSRSLLVLNQSSPRGAFHVLVDHGLTPP